MNICGVLIHARPEHSLQVNQRLQQFPGVEVHAATDDGRLVVTIENDSTDHSSAAATVIELQQLQGVLSAALVYQYNDEYDLSQ